MFGAHVAGGAKCDQVSQIVGFLVSLYAKFTKRDNVVYGWRAAYLLFGSTTVLTGVIVARQSLFSLRQPILATFMFSAAFPKRVVFASEMLRMPVATTPGITKMPFAAIYPIPLALKMFAALCAFRIDAVPGRAIFADGMIVPTLLGAKLPVCTIARNKHLTTMLTVFLDFAYCSTRRIAALLRTVIIGTPNRMRKALPAFATGCVNYAVNNDAARITIPAFCRAIAKFPLSRRDKFFAAKATDSIDFLACALRFMAAIGRAKLCLFVWRFKRVATSLANMLHKRKPPVARSIGRVFRTLQWQQEAGFTIA